MVTQLRHKIANNSQKFLEPGEVVHEVIPAQTFNGWLVFLILVGVVPYLIAFACINRYRAVLVTDRRILVLDTGTWTMGTPKKALYQLPRATTIGTPRGLWWKCTTLGDTVWVHKKFHKDVRAADAALTTR